MIYSGKHFIAASVNTKVQICAKLEYNLYLIKSKYKPISTSNKNSLKSVCVVRKTKKLHI